MEKFLFKLKSMALTRDSHLFLLLCFFTFTQCAFALAPDEILIITNETNPASIRVAEHYCKMRNVPTDNILKLSLDAPLDDTISRQKYNDQLVTPIRAKLSEEPFASKIKCLLTTYGVPYKVTGRSVTADSKSTLAELKTLAADHAQIVRGTLTQMVTLGRSISATDKPIEASTHEKLISQARSRSKLTLQNIQRLSDPDLQQKQLALYTKYYQQLFGIAAMDKHSKSNPFLRYALTHKQQSDHNNKVKKLQKMINDKLSIQKKNEIGYYDLYKDVQGFCGSLTAMDNDMKILNGIETSASVDSELSMLKFDDYELYRHQPNELKQRNFWFDVKTLMVSRIDGPSEKIALGLIDKAVSAERIDLAGSACFDSGKSGDGEYKLYNEYIRKTATDIRKKTNLKVVEETTPALFQPGKCPETVLYCGWYSLENYIDAFDFVNGAVGYHIASFEAIKLRDPETKQWVSSMLRDGITATIGPVAEPYLVAFPKPNEFFSQLINGKQLAEAYYRTKPFNSWQMMLIGDPLYKMRIPRK